MANLTDQQRAAWDPWFAGKDFTVDWASRSFAVWAELLAPLKGAAPRILEIGSHEGRSAIFLLEFLPGSTIACIDTFMLGSEKRFDANLRGYGKRVTKIAARSVSALEHLRAIGRPFDLIYVDGSHRRDDTLTDSLLAWPLLKPGGIMIWDDYGFEPDWPSADRPTDAIEAFLNLHAGDFVEIHRDYQLAIRRAAPAGDAGAAAAGSSDFTGLHVARTPRNLWRLLTGRLPRA